MKITLLVFATFIFSLSIFAQRNGPGELRRFTLTSPYASDGHGKLKMSEKANRNCFDLVGETEVFCESRWDLVYGNMRASEEWDWFQVSSGMGVRTKIIAVGKKDRTDQLEVPFIEPFPRLKRGENRQVSVDASGVDGVAGARGQDGADGAPGVNADGTVTARTRPSAGKVEVKQAALRVQERPVSTSADYIRVRTGEMYAVRVVDETNDFYVLMRVDEVVRGRTATVSWKRVDSPKPKEPKKEWKKP